MALLSRRKNSRRCKARDRDSAEKQDWESVADGLPFAGKKGLAESNVLEGETLACPPNE